MYQLQAHTQANNWDMGRHQNQSNRCFNFSFFNSPSFKSFKILKVKLKGVLVFARAKLSVLR